MTPLQVEADQQASGTDRAPVNEAKARFEFLVVRIERPGARIAAVEFETVAKLDVDRAGHRVAGEEGVFQFEPWLWGSGAKLDAIGSPEAVSAGQLISDWIGKGWAPRSAVTDNQSASWDLFLTGEYGFAENGSWFASAAAANKDFSVGMIPIPGKTTAVAPVPTGGEFAVAPTQTTDASNHYANAKAVISCLVSGDAAKTTSELLGYLSAKPDVRAAQVAANDTWTPWVSIIEGAQGRTTELGAGYVNASAQISQAIQGALNAAGDASGVEAAFKDAAGS